MSVVNMFFHKSLTFGLCLFCLSGLTLAADVIDNTAEPVFILADQMFFNLESDTSTYSGNVNIKQGTMSLSGDNIELQYKDNAVIKIIAKGNPAKYHQIGTDGADIKAQSQLLRYIAKENRLIMTKQAKLTQQDQVIESDHIVYDTEKQTLVAGQTSTSSEPSQRVKITLTPNSNP